jgi:hypothetical protein
MTHTIQISAPTANDATYGILGRSRFIYSGRHGSGPLRVIVWSNVNRPNPGETRWNAYGSVGGNGRYLDPHNKGTDAAITVLISPEATMITAERTGTGHPLSGQVWAPDHKSLVAGDTLTLVMPDGSVIAGTADFSDGNGHGHMVIEGVEATL